LLPLILALAAGLGYAVLSLPDQAQGLQGAVADQLKKSGVSNPVTAVLLNFRGYDTLLEMVVLLLALLGVWSLGAQPGVCTESDPGPVLDTLTRLLVPVLVLVATYFLWAGVHAPGGHFRPGRSWRRPECCGFLTRGRLRHGLARLPLRIALVAGVAAFMAVDALTLQTGRHVLEYLPVQAGSLMHFGGWVRI
jgi:multisubunit Na+/H+ antiporter MnhB subunit